MGHRLKRIWAALKRALTRFFHHPLQTVWGVIRRSGLAVSHGLQAIFRFIAHLLSHISPLWWKRMAYTALALFVLVVVGFIGLMRYVENAVVPMAPPDQVHYASAHGWGASPSSADRELFYHTPQGSYLRNLRYDWLEHLERPWSTRRFAEPGFMRAYGFIIENAQVKGNDAKLPVGFAARYDADTGETMLDVSCAVCHTGELNYVANGVRTAVRIDGGSGHQDFFTAKPGFFAGDLFASLFATYVNPMKWARFAQNVLGRRQNAENTKLLRETFGQTLWAALKQGLLESRLHVYPVLEGYGRTDGLGRILNGAFAYNLTEDNYRVANAPVSYPPVWNMWKFDWVQYMASVRQPMARNIGESMGTGARYWLHDPYGKPVPPSDRYNASTLFVNLAKLETALQRLRPPCWPEDVFGKVDRCLAIKGQAVFQQHCAGCHGVNKAKDYRTMLDAPGKIAAKAPHWIMTAIPIQDIGTDPQSALNFVRYRMDLTKTSLRADEIRTAMTPYYREQYARLLVYYPAFIADQDNSAADRAQAETKLAHLLAIKEAGYLDEELGSIDLASVSSGQGLNYLIKLIRDQAYQDMGLKPEQYAEWDGFGQLDIPQVLAQYKARPLAGIWGTPPFLHNGAVPTIYVMLVPAYRRPKTFYRKSQDYDPVHLGLEPDQQEKNAMFFDTTLTGNSNAGHEFRAGYQPWKPNAPPQYGVIGPELSEDERYALLEYLKVHRDDLEMESCPAQIPQPPTPADQAACAAKPVNAASGGRR